jgi:hypothetical protein
MRPRESSHGAANEIRVCDQSEDSKGDRSDDTAERAGASGSGDQVSDQREAQMRTSKRGAE